MGAATASCHSTRHAEPGPTGAPVVRAVACPDPPAACSVDFSVNFAGFDGRICIAGDCSPGGGVTKTYHLAPGTHAVTSLSSVDDARTTAMGSLTVKTDGTVSPDGKLAVHFEPDPSHTTLTVKT